MDAQYKAFLSAYLISLPSTHKHHQQPITSGYFCNDEESANNCSDLIYQGIKTATCSMKYWYDIEAESYPRINNLHIVTDWYGKPTSIIETTRVEECKFKNVSEKFAANEGEGDMSLDYWEKQHWQFFEEECKAVNITASKNMVLVLENFHVVFK